MSKRLAPSTSPSYTLLRFSYPDSGCCLLYSRTNVKSRSEGCKTIESNSISKPSGCVVNTWATVKAYKVPDFVCRIYSPQRECTNSTCLNSPQSPRKSLLSVVWIPWVCRITEVRFNRDMTWYTGNVGVAAPQIWRMWLGISCHPASARPTLLQFF